MNGSARLAALVCESLTMSRARAGTAPTARGRVPSSPLLVESLLEALPSLSSQHQGR